MERDIKIVESRVKRISKVSVRLEDLRIVGKVKFHNDGPLLRILIRLERTVRTGLLVEKGGGSALQILHERDRLRVCQALTSVKLMVICCYQRVLENQH